MKATAIRDIEASGVAIKGGTKKQFKVDGDAYSVYLGDNLFLEYESFELFNIDWDIGGPPPGESPIWDLVP